MGRHRPRHSVRIIKRRIPSRAAALSLAAVSATAVVAFGAWRWWHTDDAVVDVKKGLADIELEWKCEEGHTFTELGQADSRPCSVCGKAAHPITVYFCEIHGPVEVAARFAVDPDGVPRVFQVKFPGGEWVRASGGLRCPRCGNSLGRNPDPLDGIKRSKRRSGS